MSTKTFALEIGTEELPAFDLHGATKQLPGLVAEKLDAVRVPHGDVTVYTTPRRLIAMVADVPEQTEAVEEVFRGPAVKIAFDADGNPTKAALGFARGKGVDPSQLERRDENGTEYVYAVKSTPAMQVEDLLPDVVLGIINGISWPKSQRWGAHDEQFSRPVRWLVAMLGADVVPVTYAGVTSGNVTYGHRFLAPAPIELADAAELVDAVRGAYVVPSEEEREASIREQIKAIEQKTGLVADLPAHTMAEVVNLAEYPTVMVGHFDKLFLEVPKEIIVDAMLVHQRYFPLFDKDGALTNAFLITSNGDPAFEQNIVDGNQRVVAARLYDAKFFFDEDRKRPLEAYVDKLDSVVFQEKLGTVKAKTERIVKLAKHLADDAHVDEQTARDAARAAYLCKADLVTSAVIEFTSVQGIMGYYYALASGENETVAQAIADHYRPRFSGDALPESTAGRIVAFADKLDTICGLFAIDQAPTGSSDPFALRRAAIGIVGMLTDGLDVSLTDAVRAALRGYREDGLEFDEEKVADAVMDFIITRTKVILKDEGNASDTIDAVLAAGVREPAVIAAHVNALTEARANQTETMDDLAVAYARANNLRDAKLGTDCDPSLFTPVEAELAEAVQKAGDNVGRALADDDYATALSELAALRAPIDAFFEGVMVMDEDERLRDNRLKLLNRFVGTFTQVADFGLLAK